MRVTNDGLDLVVGHPVAAWAAHALRATPRFSGFSGVPARTPQATRPMPHDS